MNAPEIALTNAQFFIAIIKEFRINALTNLLTQSELRVSYESTGYWVHIYTEDKQAAILARENFDVLACSFCFTRDYVGFRIIHQGARVFEFYFASNPRFVSILDPVSFTKQRGIWLYKREVIASTTVNVVSTEVLTRQVIRALKESLPLEANRVLSLSCINVVPLIHKITLEISVPTYDDAMALIDNYLRDLVLSINKLELIDIIYFFVGLIEEDRVCCGRFAITRYDYTKK